jgi:peptidoglycan/LPS O-acetylase OafA/YrhL
VPSRRVLIRLHASGLARRSKGGATRVVLFHANAGNHIETVRANTPAWLYGLVFEAGHYGVAIFFALSGFVIAHSIRDADLTGSFLARFALRRSLRLDPPYWLSIAFALLLSPLSLKVTGKLHNLPSSPQVLAHLVYVQEIARVPEIVPAYWTLTYEVQFYIVLVASLVASRLGGPVILSGLAVLSALGLYPDIPGLFVKLWCAFYVGTLAYWAHRSNKSLAMLLALAILMLIAQNMFFGN